MRKSKCRNNNYNFYPPLFIRQLCHYSFDNHFTNHQPPHPCNRLSRICFPIKIEWNQNCGIHIKSEDTQNIVPILLSLRPIKDLLLLLLREDWRTPNTMFSPSSFTTLLRWHLPVRNQQWAASEYFNVWHKFIPQNHQPLLALGQRRRRRMEKGKTWRRRI